MLHTAQEAAVGHMLHVVPMPDWPYKLDPTPVQSGPIDQPHVPMPVYWSSTGSTHSMYSRPIPHTVWCVPWRGPMPSEPCTPERSHMQWAMDGARASICCKQHAVLEPVHPLQAAPRAHPGTCCMQHLIWTSPASWLQHWNWSVGLIEPTDGHHTLHGCGAKWVWRMSYRITFSVSTELNAPWAQVEQVQQRRLKESNCK